MKNEESAVRRQAMDILHLLNRVDFWLSSSTIGVVCYFAGLWGPQLFKHAFDQRLENFKRRLALRDRVSVIADVLSVTPDEKAKENHSHPISG